MLVGENKGFEVYWECSLQEYTVFYNTRYMTTQYKYSDVKCYLD